MTHGTAKTACDRCGSCCRQGGPALHGGDRHLVASGSLRLEHLITVRRGELAFRPLAEEPEPVRDEFLKVRGQGGGWCCMFYDAAARGCTIYGKRPLACGLLECFRPGKILAIAGRDLLTRFDCIDTRDPLLPLVRRHEELCPCPDLFVLDRRLQGTSSPDVILQELTDQVGQDLVIRSLAVRGYGLSVDLELFYFGRPLFQLLAPLGVVTRETGTGLILQYDRN